MDKKYWLECLEAVLLFILPLFLGISLYVLGSITDVSGHYILYTVYLIGSVALTKYNGRSLAEIGLTHKGFFSSLGNSLVFVVAFLVARVVAGNPSLTPDVNSWTAVVYNLFYWTLSGFGQEVLFRGFILFSFDRWRGWRVALLVSSVLFGIVHLQRYPNVSGLVVMGLIGGYWGWTALKTKNVVGTAVAHSIFNFLFAFVLVT